MALKSETSHKYMIMVLIKTWSEILRNRLWASKHSIRLKEGTIICSQRQLVPKTHIKKYLARHTEEWAIHDKEMIVIIPN